MKKWRFPHLEGISGRVLRKLTSRTERSRDDYKREVEERIAKVFGSRPAVHLSQKQPDRALLLQGKIPVDIPLLGL